MCRRIYVRLTPYFVLSCVGLVGQHGLLEKGLLLLFFIQSSRTGKDFSDPFRNLPCKCLLFHIVTPSQDMVLGNYYLTMEEAGREGEGMIFKDRDEAVMTYRNGYVHLHSRVGIATDSLNKPWTEEQKHIADKMPSERFSDGIRTIIKQRTMHFADNAAALLCLVRPVRSVCPILPN
ncbi:TPA: hypothetical protein ACQUH4_000692 [Neisseria cinerea]